MAIEDHLGETAKKRAAEKGMSLSAFVSHALQQVLAAEEPVAPPPFCLVTVGGGGVVDGVVLDRTSELLDAEEVDRFSAAR